ncbi:hypothetical protein VPHD479_0044 [Vibrio phage D479]
MHAILIKETDEVAIINIGETMTMPALFIKREHAEETLYKNDMQHTCYVREVFPQVFLDNPQMKETANARS